MKKLTLSAIRNYLETLPTNTEFNNPAYDGASTTRKTFPIIEIIAELDAELNRGAEAKAIKSAEYEAVKGIVLSALSTTPVTINELYEAIKDELPSNFTKGKLQYGITFLWKDSIERITGKINTYRAV